MSESPSPPEKRTPLRPEKPVYGGDALARTDDGRIVLVPFALPGELVVLQDSPLPPVLLESSPDRVPARCVHFGVCGGCQYQMARYPAQLAMKRVILQETLDRAGVSSLPGIVDHPSPDPWGYRNRIRLHLRRKDEAFALGYHRRVTGEFLPIRMCPIAAPLLWTAAEALLTSARADAGAAAWLGLATEVEISCNEAAERVQVHLLCPEIGSRPQKQRRPAVSRGGAANLPSQKDLIALATGIQAAGIHLVSLGASRLHVASGRAVQALASWGAEGLLYNVEEQRFWLERGNFFQVNRFLLPAMVRLVLGERAGMLAWDLYAGVGLFTRALATRFARVTAVEANPAALGELRRGLVRAGDQAVESTTVAFLRKAVLERDRPELVVLDPPRAGAGDEVCRLLMQLSPPTLVYVSCDPTTLARDAATLQESGYTVAELHLLDLFPQTYHLETVMVLQRTGVGR